MRSLDSWIPVALSYMLGVGALGVTTKLALRDLNWAGIMVCTAAVYAIAAVALIGARLPAFAPGWSLVFGALTGVIAAGSLILFFVALSLGPANRVVPVTAAYPIVTVVLAALVLGEPFALKSVFGAAIVAVGVIVVMW